MMKKTNLSVKRLLAQGFTPLYEKIIVSVSHCCLGFVEQTFLLVVLFSVLWYDLSLDNNVFISVMIDVFMNKFLISVVFGLCSVGLVQASCGKRDRSLSPSTQQVLNAHYQSKLSKSPLVHVSVLNIATDSAFSNSVIAQNLEAKEVVAAFKRQQYNKSMNLVAQAVKDENISPDFVSDLERSFVALRVHNELVEGSPKAIDAINAMEAQLRSLSRN